MVCVPVEKAKPRLKRLEDALASERSSDGPYFNGAEFSLVDAAYGPFFQRFAICESVLKTGILDEFPQVKAWSQTLLGDDRVVGAGEFPTRIPRQSRPPRGLCGNADAQRRGGRIRVPGRQPYSSGFMQIDRNAGRSVRR